MIGSSQSFIVSPVGLSVIHCPITPGLNFESVFCSLVLSLYGPCGKAVVNVEEPACTIDYPLMLPVSNKINRAFWENGVKGKSDAKFFI